MAARLVCRDGDGDGDGCCWLAHLANSKFYYVCRMASGFAGERDCDVLCDVVLGMGEESVALILVNGVMLLEFNIGGRWRWLML